MIIVFRSTVASSRGPSVGAPPLLLPDGTGGGASVVGATGGDVAVEAGVDGVVADEQAAEETNDSWYVRFEDGPDARTLNAGASAAEEPQCTVTTAVDLRTGSWATRRTPELSLIAVSGWISSEKTDSHASAGYPANSSKNPEIIVRLHGLFPAGTLGTGAQRLTTQTCCDTELPYWRFSCVTSVGVPVKLNCDPPGPSTTQGAMGGATVTGVGVPVIGGGDGSDGGAVGGTLGGTLLVGMELGERELGACVAVDAHAARVVKASCIVKLVALFPLIAASPFTTRRPSGTEGSQINSTVAIQLAPLTEVRGSDAKDSWSPVALKGTLKMGELGTRCQNCTVGTRCVSTPSQAMVPNKPRNTGAPATTAGAQGSTPRGTTGLRPDVAHTSTPHCAGTCTSP